MAQKISLKRSAVPNKVPVAGDIDYGELALNYNDGKIFYKKVDNTIDYFQSGLQTINLTGDITGSGTGNITTTLSATGAAAGSYINANITVGADGRITAVANGSASGLPDQTGNTGKYLTTDGSTASWGTINLSGYQPIDADLTAIGGLTGTSGILTKTAANTWALDTNTYLTTTNAAATYQPVDADLTSIAGLAGTAGILKKTALNTWALDTTSYQPQDGDLTAIAALAGTSGLLKKTAADTWTLDTSTYLTGITSGQVTTALGYTPYNSTNPNGYITSAALASYLPLSGGTLTGDLTVTRIRGTNNLVLNSYATVNPSSNVFIYSQSNDRDSWLYLDSADTGSNWGIYHRQIDTAVAGLPGNSIGFVGGGTSALKAYISLMDGSANFAGAITQAGNQVLHAGNYSSYALPLSGGTLSGTLTTSGGLYATKIGVSSSNLADTVNGAPWYGIGHTDLNFQAAQIPQFAGYYGLRIRSASTVMDFAPNGDAGNINVSSGGFKIGGNVALHAGNYNSYSPTLTGGNASGTWGINVTGSAGSAPANGGTATALNSSNYISRTGSTGNLNTDFNNTPAGSQRYQGDDSNITNSPGNTWWIYEHKRHSSSSNYWGTQVAWGWEDNANRLAQRNVSGGGWSSWVYYLNSSNYSSYALPISGGTLTGNLTSPEYYCNGWFRSNNNNTGLYNQTNQNHIYSRAGNRWGITGNDSGSNIYLDFFGTYESTLRGSIHADTSSNLGFLSSGGSWTWRVDQSGNSISTANVTAYSDERLKTDWTPLPSNYVSRLATVKNGTYTRKDIGERQAGSSAQDWQSLLPEVVMVGNDEQQILSLAYGNAALVSAIELAKDNVDLRARLEKLEAIIATLIKG